MSSTALAIALVAAPPAKPAEALEGVWSFERVVVDGREQPKAPAATNTMTIAGDGRYVVRQGKRVTRGIMRPAEKPSIVFEFTITDGPMKNLRSEGIHKREGEKLVLCLSLRKGPRPESFDAPAGSGCMLQVFQREKQTVEEAFAEADRIDLEGKWRTTSGRGVFGSEFEIECGADGRISLIRDGKAVEAKYTLSYSGASPRIDLSWESGEHNGKTSKGLYRLSDGEWTLAVGPPGGKAPTSIDGDPLTGGWTAVLRKPPLK